MVIPVRILHLTSYIPTLSCLYVIMKWSYVPIQRYGSWVKDVFQTSSLFVCLQLYMDLCKDATTPQNNSYFRFSDLLWFKLGINKIVVLPLIWREEIRNIIVVYCGLCFTLLCSCNHLQFLSNGVRFSFQCYVFYV